MKGLAVFITSLFVTMSVSAQTEAEADSIDTSAFDKYLDEIVIVAKKPGTVVKTDRKVYTVNQDLTSKASSASEILNHIPSVEVDIKTLGDDGGKDTCRCPQSAVCRQYRADRDN